MIRDMGYVEPGTTLYIPFHTFDSNDPSASVTLTGLATTDIEIYKDGSTTQRASDNGYALLDTDGIDFDGITGIHGISINLADNSTAGFYAAGSQYWVVISSVTVDAATVNFVLATFRIGYQGAHLNTTIASLSSQTSFTLTNGPAEDDALNGSMVLIHDVASAVQKGYAVVSDYTGSTKTVTLLAGTTFTAAATDNIAFYPPVNASHAGAVAYTATRGLAGTALPNAAANAAGGLPISIAGSLDLDARLDAAVSSRASQTSVDAVDDFLDTEIAAIKAKTDGLPGDPADASDIALAFTSLNTKVDTIDDFLDTEVAAILAAVDTEVAAIKAKTDNLPSDPADASDIAAAFTSLNTKVDTIDDFLDTEIAAIKAKTDNLPASPAATSDIPSANAVADQVWDEVLSGHAGVGSAGAALSAAGGSGDPWSTALPGSYGSGTAGKIIGDNLNATISSRASQTSVDTVDDFLDTEIAAIKAKTDNLPSDPGDQSAIEAAITAATSLLATAANLATLTTYVDTEVAAIKAKTDNLPSDPADASDIASSFSTINSTLSTIAAYIDTEVAAIKAKTDNLPASPAATGDIPTAVQNADALLGRNVAGGSSSGRTVKEALYFLRNKWTVSGGTLTVYATDDTTSAWTSTVSTDDTAEPVTGSDPS